MGRLNVDIVHGHGVGPKFWSENFGPEFLGPKFGFGPEQVLIILGRPEPEARFDSRTGIRNDNLDNNYVVSF